MSVNISLLVYVMVCHLFWCQALTNAILPSTGPLPTNFNEIWIKTINYSCKEIHLKMSSAQYRPFCLSLLVLNNILSNSLWWVSEWVIKFNGLSRTADSEVHIVHISRVIIACTLKFTMVKVCTVQTPYYMVQYNNIIYSRGHFY